MSIFTKQRGGDKNCGDTDREKGRESGGKKYGREYGKKYGNKTASDAELYAFLPAAIEVEQTPSSKAGRLIIWLIVSLFTMAVLWASFGNIDIVAVAQGKVIPTESVKQIQSLETARIKSIHVTEGQIVEKGQVLIELNSLLVKAEHDGLKAELIGAEQNIQRLSLLSSYLHSLGGALVLEGLSSQQQAQFEQEQSEVTAQLKSFNNERAKSQTEQRMTQAEISKKQLVLPVLQERVDALDTLQKKSYGSKLQYLEIKQELIELKQDLAVQNARLIQLKQAEQSVTTQQTLYLTDKRKQTLASLNALQVQYETLVQQVTKAAQRLQHYTLVAPVTGQVQQLATTTVGGVVQSAQTLMQIVPSESALEVDAVLLNKDIGFVQEGQRVVVKVNTFNFTKYGMIDGTVRYISDDAIENNTQDENLGLVYSARVGLNSDRLMVEGREVRLSPGMSVTAEIKTGQRRLIEFFMSPLLRYKQESLGER